MAVQKSGARKLVTRVLATGVLLSMYAFGVAATTGAMGVFCTSTGENPGTNRFEIAGDRGKLVLENGKLTYTRNEVPMRT